jgi:hypothetical protein
MVDEETAPEAVPEVGDVAPDPSMEVAAEPGPEEPAQPEVGTAVEVVEDGGDITVEPEPEPEPEPEAEAEAEPEAEPEAEAEESSPAEDQANYEPPPALDQASYVQGLMVAGSNEGQDARRESLVRNRERRRLQQEAIRRSNQG